MHIKHLLQSIEVIRLSTYKTTEKKKKKKIQIIIKNAV